MANSNNPVFVRVAKVQWGTISASNTARDGTGTVVTVWTADASLDGYVDSVQFQPLGSNTTSVGRVFLNNGLTNATPANNTLIAEVTLTTTTATELAGLPTYVVPLKLMVPAGYKLNVVLGTAVSAGFAVTAFGGDF